MKWLFNCTIVLLFVGVLAACGSDDDKSNPNPQPTNSSPGSSGGGGGGGGGPGAAFDPMTGTYRIANPEEIPLDYSERLCGESNSHDRQNKLVQFAYSQAPNRIVFATSKNGDLLEAFVFENNQGTLVFSYLDAHICKKDGNKWDSIAANPIPYDPLDTVFTATEVKWNLINSTVRNIRFNETRSICPYNADNGLVDGNACAPY